MGVVKKILGQCDLKDNQFGVVCFELNENDVIHVQNYAYRIEFTREEFIIFTEKYTCFAGVGSHGGQIGII